MGRGMSRVELIRRTNKRWHFEPVFKDPPENERNLMATLDKAKNKVQEAKGDLEEAAGKATKDRSRQAKGKRDKASGNLKQAGEKVNDAFGK
jgi:uncharacterized protein YjbJ (UPF0337 family)